MKTMNLLNALAGLLIGFQASASESMGRDYTCHSQVLASNGYQFTLEIDSSLVSNHVVATLRQQSMNAFFGPLTQEITRSEVVDHVRTYAGLGFTLQIDLRSGMISLPPVYSAVVGSDLILGGRSISVSCFEGNPEQN